MRNRKRERGSNWGNRLLADPYTILKMTDMTHGPSMVAVVPTNTKAAELVYTRWRAEVNRERGRGWHVFTHKERGGFGDLLRFGQSVKIPAKNIVYLDSILLVTWYIISISLILLVCLRTIRVLVYADIKYSTSIFYEYDI